MRRSTAVVHSTQTCITRLPKARAGQQHNEREAGVQKRRGRTAMGESTSLTIPRTDTPLRLSSSTTRLPTPPVAPAQFQEKTVEAGKPACWRGIRDISVHTTVGAVWVWTFLLRCVRKVR